MNFSIDRKQKGYVEIQNAWEKNHQKIITLQGLFEE